MVFTRNNYKYFINTLHRLNYNSLQKRSNPSRESYFQIKNIFISIQQAKSCFVCTYVLCEALINRFDRTSYICGYLYNYLCLSSIPLDLSFQIICILQSLYKQLLNYNNFWVPIITSIHKQKEKHKLEWDNLCKPAECSSTGENAIHRQCGAVPRRFCRGFDNADAGEKMHDFFRNLQEDLLLFIHLTK